jgi:hypothetical protein
METHPTTAWCQCQWSPNDIAHQLVYGGLTAMIIPRPVAVCTPEGELVRVELKDATGRVLEEGLYRVNEDGKGMTKTEPTNV